ncbi:MAG: DNA polymerase IV [Pseudomonadales bacterium]|nr:DNA polymerase IV [Pseudomonadales bacterium]
MTATPRKIIHCDCDCFYASIEMRDNPAYAGKPLAVGGSPERRGVVATCNYEARRFGIHSAMPMATALRHCPHLTVVFPRMERYREASRAVHRIFRDYTALIEPLSLDEAYLDVTEATACQGSATLIAEEIRRRVREEVGITISAGIAPNKFIAKVASDWNKPDGQYVVTPAQIDAFVRALPVKKIFGVGKVTAGRLNSMGVHTCEDLRAYDSTQLTEHFGSFGERLYRLCRGIDERPVNTERIRKSLSVENTYATDLPDLAACLERLPELHEQLEARLAHVTHDYRVSKKYMKLKFKDFVSTTIEMMSDDTQLADYISLCGDAFARGNRPVRLLGLGVKLEPLLPKANSSDHAHPRKRQLPLRLD